MHYIIMICRSKVYQTMIRFKTGAFLSFFHIAAPTPAPQQNLRHRQIPEHERNLLKLKKKKKKRLLPVVYPRKTKQNGESCDSRAAVDLALIPVYFV